MVFWKELIIEDSLPATTSLSLNEEWPLVCLVVVHFTCPMIFSLPITICCKTGTFSLHLSRGLHVEIRSQRVFFA